MSLTSVNDIERTVGYDPRGFSFLSTVNDLVGNLEYSRGSRAALDGVDDHSTFYWRALSAAGSEMADTVYENVRHYIQCVADVDTCKLTALRSMLKLFNYKATVLDNFLAFPVEVLRLVDVLSIDKKYLKEAGFAARGLLADLAASGVVGRRDGAYRANFRDESTDCSLTLSADELGGSMRRLLGAYSGCAPVQSLSAGWALRAM